LYEKAFDYEAMIEKTVAETRYLIVDAFDHRDITLEGLIVSEVLAGQQKD
jgi:hypothetical protein